jgi:hypothetical protein
MWVRGSSPNPSAPFQLVLCIPFPPQYSYVIQNTLHVFLPYLNFFLPSTTILSHTLCSHPLPSAQRVQTTLDFPSSITSKTHSIPKRCLNSILTKLSVFQCDITHVLLSSFLPLLSVADPLSSLAMCHCEIASPSVQTHYKTFPSTAERPLSTRDNSLNFFHAHCTPYSCARCILCPSPAPIVSLDIAEFIHILERLILTKKCKYCLHFLTSVFVLAPEFNVKN